MKIYHEAKKRGMSLVTITDHNTIDGALEIAHLPDVCVGQEITSYFPEDRCKVHVLAYNITESRHRDIQKVRENIFDLVDYLNAEQIVHTVAHPLYSINDKLTVAHFEQMLLLFKNFEINGARNAEQNRLLELILDNLTKSDIDRLAETYQIEPKIDLAWVKNRTGGSDDHSGLNIARAYTMVDDADDFDTFFQKLQKGRARPVVHPSSPKALAHNLYGIAYQFYKNKFNLDRHITGDMLLRFLDRSLTGQDTEEGGIVSKIYLYFNRKKRLSFESDMPETLLNLLRKETTTFLHENPQLHAITGHSQTRSSESESQWFDFVNDITNKIMRCFANHLMDHVCHANLFNVFQTIGSAGGLYFLLAPYFVAYNHFTKDRVLNHSLYHRFTVTGGMNQRAKIAHFTDTFFDVNGVAKTLQQMVQLSYKTGKDYTVITCDNKDHGFRKGIRSFNPIGVYDLPEYPEIKLYYPPFLEMLNYCYEENFTHIQSATPGPIGLAALAISNILKLPISGTYHTALPQYAYCLTEDEGLEELMWKFITWYYRQMNIIYVPSKATGDELIEKGIDKQKIRLFPRGIDIERFHPSKRNISIFDRYSVKETIKMLYVGRVSREKNLPMLVDAFKTVSALDKDLHLIVVGEGPYLSEMKTALAGLPCTFTGYMNGNTLATIYASSDFFVFPSTTDTFGNVVLEAQASGIPVVVSDQGGPHENIIPEKTGLIVRGKETNPFVHAIRRLAKDPLLRKTMGKNARQYMEHRSFENAFIQTWDLYKSATSEDEKMKMVKAC